MNPDEAPRVQLRPSHWVRLPGTDVEVYLHGKPGQEGIEVVRTHVKEEFGGWDLDPVKNRIFTRRAES